MRKVKLLQCLGPDRSKGMAAGTVGGENAFALTIQDGLGENRPGGVPCAEKKDIVVVGHGVVLTPRRRSNRARSRLIEA